MKQLVQPRVSASDELLPSADVPTTEVVLPINDDVTDVDMPSSGAVPADGGDAASIVVALQWRWRFFTVIELVRSNDAVFLSWLTMRLEQEDVDAVVFDGHTAIADGSIPSAAVCLMSSVRLRASATGTRVASPSVIFRFRPLRPSAPRTR